MSTQDVRAALANGDACQTQPHIFSQTRKSTPNLTPTWTFGNFIHIQSTMHLKRALFVYAAPMPPGSRKHNASLPILLRRMQQHMRGNIACASIEYRIKRKQIRLTKIFGYIHRAIPSSGARSLSLVLESEHSTSQIRVRSSLVIE